MLRHSESTIREQGVLSIKKYGDKYKVIWNKSVRKKGFEKIKPKKDTDCLIRNPFDGSLCEECDDFLFCDSKGKLDNNISRAKSMIFEYAYCNKWDYFITLTIDKEKYNRYDLKNYQKDLGKWISNYHTNHGSKICYVLIPEQHEDGAWHMHGLISGVLSKHLEVNEHGYMDFPMYRKKFGYCSLECIRDHEAVSKYITKYVTKELMTAEFGQRSYYCSKGLERAKLIMRFTEVLPDSFDWEFEHQDGFCKSFMTDNLDFLDYISMSGDIYDFT